MWGENIFRWNHIIYNFQKDSKSLGNDGFRGEFHKHFSNELAPGLLDVCGSWGKLGTMDITSRTGIISVIKKILQTTDPHTLIIKSPLQKTLDTIIDEKQSASIK